MLMPITKEMDASWYFMSRRINSAPYTQETIAMHKNNDGIETRSYRLSELVVIIRPLAMHNAMPMSCLIVARSLNITYAMLSAHNGSSTEIAPAWPTELCCNAQNLNVLLKKKE